MIKFKVDKYFVPDLRDDFVMNEDYNLYEFIDGECDTAFWLGMNIYDWWDELSKDQKYLYSKQNRHNEEFIEPYRKQIDYWVQKFASLPDSEEEVNLIDVAEYVINNVILLDEDDLIPLCYFLGQTTSEAQERMDQAEEAEEQAKKDIEESELIEDEDEQANDLH